MSGWRAALVAALVGGIVLVVGFYVGRDRPTGGVSTTLHPTEVGVRLACVPALEAVCERLAAGFGGSARTYRPGTDPGEGTVVIAPSADLPAGLTVGPVIGKSPVAVAVWLERSGPLGRHCGGVVDLACLTTAYGRTWSELGGDDNWGEFKVGLADPNGGAGALAAWQAVAGAGVPGGLAASLRLRSADDGALLADLVLFGTAKADAVVATEVAIAAQLANAIGRGGRLEVVYPDPVPWVDYVAAWSGGDGEEVARALLTPEAQAALAAAGLRPAAGAVSTLPEGLGTPGVPLPPIDDPTRSSLLDAWSALSG